MHCIYEVRYEIQWHSSKPSQWELQSVRVLAGADAQEAVDKARATALPMPPVAPVTKAALPVRSNIS